MGCWVGGWTEGLPWRRFPHLPLYSSSEASGGSAGSCCVWPAVNKQTGRLVCTSGIHFLRTE